MEAAQLHYIQKARAWGIVINLVCNCCGIQKARKIARYTWLKGRVVARLHLYGLAGQEDDLIKDNSRLLKFNGYRKLTNPKHIGKDPIIEDQEAKAEKELMWRQCLLRPETLMNRNTAN